MSRNKATLLDIANAARLIIEFVKDLDEESFLQDPKTQSAVLHQLLVIGEAVKRLPAEFRSRHSEIPWPLIAGMRDKVIHAYDAIDLQEVWQTTFRDMPDLLSSVESLLDSAD